MLTKSKIKLIQSLKLKKYRTKYNLFIAEGDKLIHTVIHQNTCHFNEIYALEDWVESNTNLIKDLPHTIVSKKQLKSLSNLKTAPEVLAVIEIPTHDPLEKLPHKALYLDAIQDPGNVGTIMRTADWFGIRTVIRSPDSADFFGPKVVQGSMGSFARLHLSCMEREELIHRAVGSSLIGADSTGKNYKMVTFPEKTCLVIGNEGQGISPVINRVLIEAVRIPGDPYRSAESLNASIAAGILCAHWSQSL